MTINEESVGSKPAKTQAQSQDNIAVITTIIERHEILPIEY